MGELVRLNSLLSDYYDDVVDMHTLATAEQPQLDNLNVHVEQAELNMYVATADSDGLAVFEDMLGITKSAGSTVESRRKVIFARLLNRKPYTMTYLRAVLSTLGGPASVKLEADKYQLDVDVSLDQPNQTDELDHILTTVVPVNMAINAKNTISAAASGVALFCAGAVFVDTFMLTNDWRSTQQSSAEARDVAAVASIDTFGLTNDWRGNESLQAVALNATGVLGVDTQTLTHDWHDDTVLHGNQLTAGVITGLEVIEVASE
ncbi:putative phage tail protein [Lacticaseibacillus sharpeae]|uniref:DUF2313 domain-containing protein n=1 Tax=Lacticaseibacillus sharpeae JCM 1186 = DSM 20505 TaxID=1291052 RepID=A0A0R1ZIC9_9LACO|nr:putative phage tail protein [Lacticaseibacillus sharpeae]KRM54631.1 hypothetical protein FC18_GL002342 [Lacticaseibacillus sharpeae JCM 1186 = DSM 20505]